MSLKFKCSPELADGSSWTVFTTPQEVAEAVLEWTKYQQEYGTVGESCNIQIVEMSDQELNALPEL